MSNSVTDVLVVGSGIAGLSAALGAARKGVRVTVATKASRPDGASTWWAQGGIAVARRNPTQLKEDIEAASSGTSDPEAVDVLVQHADAAVRDVLIDTLEVDFDTRADGHSFDFGREAAHSADRILHVDASTGKYVHRPFLRYLAEHEHVQIWNGVAALDLLTTDRGVEGAVVQQDERMYGVSAGATILATGGVGALYPRSTNPAGATGDGIAMAVRAGAETRDMEYVQFHPTVCVVDGTPFLVSEAVRGEGALLRNANGERFMPEIHPDAELASRDVVARAVEQEHQATGEVVLDVSPVAFETDFPDLAALCEKHGVDWTSGIPVVPAEHFLCGGIDVDTCGRSSLDRLYAVGECARTGVHGANRLASTSLLEGLVWGLRAGQAAATHRPGRPHSASVPSRVDPPSREVLGSIYDRIQRIMGEHVGLRRRATGLQAAQRTLTDVKRQLDVWEQYGTARDLRELRSACSVALEITNAAATNETSIGCHYMVEESTSDAVSAVG